MAFCTVDLVMNYLRIEFTSDALKHFTFRTSSHTSAEQKKNQEFMRLGHFAAFGFITVTRTAHSMCAYAHYHFPHQVQHIASGKTQ